MKTEKILSVAVPSYNVSGTIRKCLDSFADRNLSDDLEVIVVNDGSTDDTEEIVSKYVRKLPDIFRLVNQENGGHGSAVIAGISHASGKYFRIVDGDDWVDTEELLLLMDFLRTSDADYVVDVKVEYNVNTHVLQRYDIPAYIPLEKLCLFEDICTMKNTESYIMIHTLNVRTELFKNSRFSLPRHVFYEDFEYVTKATLLGDTIVFVDRGVYQYRVGSNEQSVSAENYVKKYDHHNKVLMRLLSLEHDFESEGKKKDYLRTRVRLFINTQMNIGLIFDKNRRRGYRRITILRKQLKERFPYFERVTRKRYYIALILHWLGVDYDRLRKLMGRV